MLTGEPLSQVVNSIAIGAGSLEVRIIRTQIRPNEEHIVIEQNIPTLCMHLLGQTLYVVLCYARQDGSSKGIRL